MTAGYLIARMAAQNRNLRLLLGCGCFSLLCCGCIGHPLFCNFPLLSHAIESLSCQVTFAYKERPSRSIWSTFVSLP